MISKSNSLNKLPLSFNAWKLIDKKGVELIKINLEPNDEIAMHPNSVPVIFYCISGSAELSIENETMEFSTGMAIDIKANVLRALKNSSKNRVELLVYKQLGV